ncbi:MAG TPA: hypothetical protein VF109_10030 [Mycobacteriales bacterium]
MTPELPVPEEEEEEETSVPAPRPTRRERRGHNGDPALTVPRHLQGRRFPVPAKGRDYAHRRRG